MTRALPIRSLALCAALSLAACDDGDGGASTGPIDDPATVMQGQRTGEQSASLTEIQAGADQMSAQGQITLVGQSIQAFAGQHQAFKAQQAAQSGLTASAAPLAEAVQAQVAEEFSFEDGHLRANVNYSNGMSTILYQVDMQIDQLEPGYTLNGSFNMDFDVSQGMYDIDYVYDATYENLTFDGAGCPVGGGFSVRYAYTLSGEFLNSLPPESRAQIEQSAAANGTVVASFGPNCGDVIVEGT